MNIYQAELKYFLRSPIIWLIMALTAFVSAWSFLLSIELFSSLQVKFAGMSDAPTISQGILLPVIAAQAKILMVVIAIIGGLSFSRLHNNNGWSLIMGAQYSEWKTLKQKYLAALLVTFLFIFPAILAIVSLTIIANSQILAVVFASLGLLFLLMWLLALAMFISSLVENTGFAILLCLVVFLVLWLLSIASLGQEWGKNWIQVFSPFYHFQQFSQSKIPYASWFYFLTGTVLSLWATKIRIIHKRYSL